MKPAKKSPEVLPRDASMLRRFWVALDCLRILKDDQANAGYARRLHMSLDDSTYERLGQELRAAGCPLLDQRPTVPGDVDLETLARMPEGTLGQAFAQYFKAKGIQPFTYEYPVESDGDYLYKRYRETHDLHHLLTGYGIDPTGEIELQAFYVGNLGLRHAALIAFLSIPFVIKQEGLKPKALQENFRRLRAAYERGKQSHNLLTVNYAELWETPVPKLTTRFCPPAPSAAA